ncbi:MAG: PD40 domain-containing protein [Melioribacteraceae bacterium]|nr:PD40 domain-containing protein [Melioribacteraceae bacterium]
MKKMKLIILLLTVLGTQVFAQFGQNRVQYKEQDWHYIQTNHFDIYFTFPGKIPTEFAAHAAEEALADLEGKLDYKINNRFSLVIYNSHNDFQETNTSDSYVSQGIGGFTEPFKNRVVIPFEGDYAKFRHVIHHELVHAVMRDMLYGGTVQNIISRGISLQLPLWYHEGMAEYLSSDWETNSDMFIRDAIINEYLPDIPYLSGYFAYRGGQALMKYIAEKYGVEKIAEILNKTQGLGKLEAGIKASIGLTIEELNDRWKKDLKRKYWPDIADRQDPDEFAKKLTDNKKDGGFYNTSPAISPQGDKIVFISDRDIYFDIYVINAFDGKVIDKIAESGRANDFEELNVLTPALTWAPDNKRVAISVKSSGYDRIRIIDVEEGDSYELPFKMPGVSSVSWSPKGNLIAFVGHNETQSDIYTYNFETEEVKNITNDIFTDSEPSWSIDENKIFYVSDRSDYSNDEVSSETFDMIIHNYNQFDIYSIEMDSGNIVRYTDWDLSSEKSPIVSNDGKTLLFISDYNGINNIYKIKIDEVNLDQHPVPITNSLNQIDQMSLSEDGKKLVFSSLYNSGYNIYLMNNPFELESDLEELEPTKFMASLLYIEDEVADTLSKTVLPYKDKSEYSNYVFGEIEKEDTSGSDGSPMKIFTGEYVKENSKDEDSSAVDYSNYRFVMNSDEDTVDLAVKREQLFKEKLDPQGDYLVNKYKVTFTPDIIYANAGFSTFYGLLGTTVLSFSDILGNHRLIGHTSMQVDLKNSDYGLSYYYLAKKINYGVDAFHTARFVYLDKTYSNGVYRELYRFRNFGFVLSASYPLSRFYRLDASLSYLNVTSENLDNFNLPSEEVHYAIPRLSFIHDNTMWGYYSPIEGTRYNLTAFGNPAITTGTRSFYSLTWDYRKYMRFWFDNSFVFRVSGGYSGGANPQAFMMGGTSNWINRDFARGYLPIEDATDFAFLTPALPMRGFNYAERIGSKYSLINLELRMPVIRYLLTGPLPLLFRNILGTAFIDVGTAWNKNEKLQLFHKNEKNETVAKDLLMGTGYGLRTFFLFALVRMDVAWAFDGKEFSEPRYYFSLGVDF